MKNKKIEQLKPLYLFILVLTLILVGPTHLFPSPSFMPLRFPHYLEMMGPFLGVSWPMTFEIYHYALFTLAVIGNLNVLGIIFYPRLRKIAIASSLTGLFLIPLMILFFFIQFMNINSSTAILYGLYSIVLLIVDILTFKAFVREPEPSQTRRKEASGEEF